jgi:hypothetical protein
MPIVTNPTAGDVHVNVPLTNFSQKYLLKAEQFVSLRAFPENPVAKQSDLYYEFDRDDWLRDEAAERADGTESAGGSFSLSTSPYFAKVYAFHKDITDRQRANQDAPVRLDQSASQFVMQKLMIQRERLFATTFMATSIWTTDVVGGAGFTKWSGASSDPIADVRTGKRVVQGLTGYRPNKMIIGREAYDTLLENDAILARITGGANNALPAMVMKQLLTQLLELEEIFIMDAIYTSSVKGASSTTRAFIGGDNALLYYAPSGVALEEPTAAMQFSWTGYLGATNAGMRTKRFRVETLESDRIEGQMAYDYKVTGADLGYFFSDCT